MEQHAEGRSTAPSLRKTNIIISGQYEYNIRKRFLFPKIKLLLTKLGSIADVQDGGKFLADP